jgi:tetratricopeptide (TPR) repeat protein
MDSPSHTALLPSWKTCFAVALLLLVAVFVTYGSSLGNEFVSLDDNGLIIGNPNVQSFNPQTVHNVFSSYDPELYIPLTFVSYQLEHLVAGDTPFLYHFDNALLHAFNAILVCWLLWLLTGDGLIAIFCALLFALHPLNTEAVAWAAARKDVLSTFFFLGSVLAYLGWRQRSGKFLYTLSLLLFLLALLSKVMVITLPAVLILMDLWQQRKLTLKVLLEKVPYALLSCIFLIIALFGKTSVIASSTWTQKILMACKSTMYYLKSFFFPTGLSVTYPYTQPITIASADFAIPLVLVLLLVAFIAHSFIRSRRPDASSIWIFAAFGLSFFLVTLTPTFVNFSKAGDVYFASDRYSYIPMIGLLCVLAALASQYLSGAQSERGYNSRRRSVMVSGAIILCIAGILSMRQSKVWANSEVLYLHALKHYPNSHLAHNNLGMEYLLAHRTSEAIAEFNTALAKGPDARTRVNLAAAYVDQNRFEEAKALFLDVMKQTPDLPDSYYGLGNQYQREGKYTEAADMYQRALQKKPDYLNALNNLGAVEIQRKNWAAAVDALTKSIALQPKFPEAYYNLGGVFEQTGDFAQAETMYRTSLQLNPNDADAAAALATVLYEQKKIDDAAQMLKHAFDLDDSSATAMQLLLRMKKDGVVR